MFVSRRYTIAVSALAISIQAMTLGAAPALAGAGFPVNVSGFEYSLGSNCNLAGAPATCGVQFGGWTGGNGPVAGGWTSFPGNGYGLWKANINYLGKAAFGGSVAVVGGSFDVLFVNGYTVQGVVVSKDSVVSWPATQFFDVGCGMGVAKVQVNVIYTRGSYGQGSFKACLHDLPAGSVIPPKIWGQLML